MTSFRIKEKIIDGILNVLVQGREWFGWITIKTFRAVEINNNETWWARACAQNLLDELQKEQ